MPDIVSVREYRRGNETWTIQRNWQQDEQKQSKNTTQYVLDTAMRKQTQITYKDMNRTTN